MVWNTCWYQCEPLVPFYDEWQLSSPAAVVGDRLGKQGPQWFYSNYENHTGNGQTNKIPMYPQLFELEVPLPNRSTRTFSLQKFADWFYKPSIQTDGSVIDWLICIIGCFGMSVCKTIAIHFDDLSPYGPAIVDILRMDSSKYLLT